MVLKNILVSFEIGMNRSLSWKETISDEHKERW